MNPPNIVSISDYEQRIDSFMLPARGALALFWLALAYLCAGFLLIPLLGLLAIPILLTGDASQIFFAANLLLFYVLLLVSLYLIYVAFWRRQPIYLAISFLCMTVFVGVIVEAFNDPGTNVFELNPTQLFIEVVTKAAQINVTWAIAGIYGLLFIWYWTKKKADEEAFFSPLSGVGLTPISALFARYGILSRHGALKNLIRLFFNCAGIYAIVMVISLPILLLGVPSWAVFPAVLTVYGAPRFWRAYNEFRRLSALAANALYEVDKRQPVLFLRSFGADSLVIPRGQILPGWVKGTGNDFVPLEEVLVNVAFKYGPVGAAANPGIQVQPLGAARQELHSEDWQDYVISKLKEAQSVVFVLGETPSLQWELKTACELNLLKKLIFVFPPRWKIHADNEEFYGFFSQVTGLPQSLNAPPIALFFSDDTTPNLLVSLVQSEREYT